VFLIGAVAAVGGFVGLLQTDGVGTNLGLGAITGVGTIVAIVGYALARFKAHLPDGNTARLGSFPTAARQPFALGIGGIVLACLVHIPFDRNERRAILTWIPDGIRPIVVIAGAAVGVVVAVQALLPKYKSSKSTGAAARLGMFAFYGGLLVMTLTVCALQLTTVQALRAILMTLLGFAGIALILVARRAAGESSKAWAVVISGVGAVALVILGLVVRSDSSATRFHTVLPTFLIICAVSLIANALIERFMEKRAFADSRSDRLGRRLQIAGALVAILGGIVRLVFTNFTAAHAAKLQEAGEPVPQNVLRQTVFWWLLVAGIGAYVLGKTRWGNWVFAVGGNKDASRAVGVPAAGVKVGLFIVVSICAALSGTLIGLRYGTVQADQGSGLEFEYIIAAVVGGCLMTGGYGTVIGASLGAAILAMSGLGFQTVSGWNTDARYAFLGGVLLVAVLVNTYTRKKALEAR
jgi:ABC-type xylose transport system permease subunit